MRWMLVAGALLLAACGEEPAAPALTDTAVPDPPAEISPNRTPTRLMVTKTGWRTGPAALIVEDPDEVTRLYALLAGNEREAFLCGYHWEFRFDYRDAPPESIAINENCEKFKRDNAEVWRALTQYFERAKNQPTHQRIVVQARDVRVKGELRRQLEQRYGLVIDNGPRNPWLTVAAREPWTAERIETLKTASPLIAKVTPIPEFDSGS